MTPEELHSITHAELHAMLKAAEREIRLHAEEMSVRAEHGDWDGVATACKHGIELVGEWDALSRALQIVTGMDVLLDDKTTRGVER